LLPPCMCVCILCVCEFLRKGVRSRRLMVVHHDRFLADSPRCKMSIRLKVIMLASQSTRPWAARSSDRTFANVGSAGALPVRSGQRLAHSTPSAPRYVLTCASDQRPDRINARRTPKHATRTNFQHAITQPPWHLLTMRSRQSNRVKQEKNLLTKRLLISLVLTGRRSVCSACNCTFYC
jgi:hypothetical protein